MLALAGLVATAAGAAEAERKLDPLLSLIGGCAGKAEPLDPVEDPGCPTTPPASAHPPAGIFAVPEAVTTDFYGNIYVSNFGKVSNGSQGRIDIFDPNGVFISELAIAAPTSIAVDSKGNLFVIAERGSAPTQRVLFRYAPSEYEPALGKIAYGEPPVTLEQPGTSAASLFSGLAIDVANDHLFANYGAAGLIEYNAADAGNSIVRITSMPGYPYGVGVAVDVAHSKIYAAAADSRIDIFDLSKTVGTPPSDEYELIGSIEGSEVPAGKFGGHLSVAVDEGTGHVFVLDGFTNVVYEFDADGSYLGTIEHSFEVPNGEKAAWIGVDNGPSSPNGKLSSEKGRYLYVPSGKTGTGHSFAFFESRQGPPEIKSVSTAGISEDEAELQGVVSPGNLQTEFTFEYLTQQRYDEEGGFSGATVLPSGQLAAGNLDVEASAAAGGLEPGTRYRFRLTVSNAEGSDAMEGVFSTYPSTPVDSGSCENDLLRSGLSALLPDCRAYELVTPADTNGRAPLGVGHEIGNFTSHQVSPTGDALYFRVEGGTLPGTGIGSYLGDPFLAKRGPSGWSTTFSGPKGSEAAQITPGWASPDQTYSFWTAETMGTALIDGKSTSYLRFPDGHSEVLGQGSIGIDQHAAGLLISQGAQHVLFATGYGGATSDEAVQIEPDAAPPTEEEKDGSIVKKGTRAIYDRTADGVVHVVSMQPGNVPFAAGESVLPVGFSLDGKGVAFSLDDTLYLRYDNTETFEIGEGVEFAGLAEGGNLLFYLEGGRLWRFDALTGQRTAFSEGPVVPVNIAANGAAAYLVSTDVLTGDPGPKGAIAEAGKENLYLSKEGAIAFVGIVTERDVVGTKGATEQVDGLGLWADAANSPTSGRFAIDPSRTNPDGTVMVFQSRAELTGYDSGGHVEIYRYDSGSSQIQCLSCNPLETTAIADASFQSESREGFGLFYPQAWIQNLRPDGKRAFFQSMEALVPGDTDGRQDVYEWEDQGVGSCTRSEGCVYLVSSGHSSRNDYLWAVSESGNDAFFLSADLLLPIDQDETPSIYDARVGGGFPEPAQAECQGEGCRPHLDTAPEMPAPQTPIHGSGDNFKPRHHHCPKGKRKVKRGGKVRCVKRHKKHRAGSGRKGGRR